MLKQLTAAIVAGACAAACFVILTLYAAEAITAGRAILYTIPAAAVAGISLKNI